MASLTPPTLQRNGGGNHDRRVALLLALVVTPAIAGCFAGSADDAGPDATLYAYHRTRGEHAVNVDVHGGGCPFGAVTLFATNLTVREAPGIGDRDRDTDVTSGVAAPLSAEGVSFLIPRHTQTVVVALDARDEPRWLLILDVQDSAWWLWSKQNGFGHFNATLHRGHAAAEIPLDCHTGGVSAVF